MSEKHPNPNALVDGQESNMQTETTNAGTTASHYASFWKRVAARLLDQVVLIIPGAILILVVDLAFQDSLRYALRNDPLEAIAIDVTKRLWKSGLVALITWLYFALFECSVYQGTPGKRALGLVVTDGNGHRLKFGRASGRYFAKLISGLTLGVGFLMALFTRKRQMLHDIIASCLVLDKKPRHRNTTASLRNCPSCGKENIEGARFCAGCGHSLVMKCPACGQDIAIFSVYCAHCGRHLVRSEPKLSEYHILATDEQKRKTFLVFIVACGATAFCILVALMWGGLQRHYANKERHYANKEREYFFEKTTEYLMLPDSIHRSQWCSSIVAPQIERWQRAAKKGNVFANFILGRTYYLGSGVKQSYYEALDYFRVAADLGDSAAQNYMGIIYNQGLGVAADPYRAMQWYRKAAQQKDYYALRNLAIMYENGQGGVRDVNQALIYYGDAAAHGDAYSRDALKRLGR